MERVRGIVLGSSDYIPRMSGEGVGVAVFDTGAALHTDLSGHIAAFRDFIHEYKEPYDDFGHGTHVCGIIGGDGRASNGRYRGIAPGCHFIVAKILDTAGNGDMEKLFAATEWIIENKDSLNIKILNISIGIQADRTGQLEGQAKDIVERAVAAGICVVTAAGNSGPDPGTISPLGSSDRVLTVGCNDLGQHDFKRFFSRMGNCDKYSSRGPTKYAEFKPDVVAPGTDITSANPGRAQYTKRSGTSMAAPIVSGIAALILEEFPHLAPSQVKALIMNNAMPLDGNLNKNGVGMVQWR